MFVSNPCGRFFFGMWLQCTSDKDLFYVAPVGITFAPSRITLAPARITLELSRITLEPSRITLAPSRVMLCPSHRKFDIAFFITFTKFS